MKVKVYNQKGEQTGTLELPKEIFEVPMNLDLLHQVLVAQMSQNRVVHAVTKGRGEVRGGGRKPWRQKGTGRARHGSIRSPLWRKGGVTFGPSSGRNYAKGINKKMKRKALFMVLSQKAREGEVFILDDLRIPEVKTKYMAEIFEDFARVIIPSPHTVPGTQKNTLASPSRRIKILVILPGRNDDILRASRNIGSLAILRADSLNVKALLSFPYLIFLKESIAVLTHTYAK